MQITNEVGFEYKKRCYDLFLAIGEVDEGIYLRNNCGLRDLQVVGLDAICAAIRY